MDPSMDPSMELFGRIRRGCRPKTQLADIIRGEFQAMFQALVAGSCSGGNFAAIRTTPSTFIPGSRSRPPHTCVT